MAKKEIPQEEDSGDSEIATVYGDMVTFLMVLFILLFVLSYNEKKEETFFVEMRVKFGGQESDKQDAVQSEAILVSNLQGYIEQEKLEEFAQILIDEQKIKLELHPPVLFKSGKAYLRKEGQKILSGFGNIMKEVKNPIIIEGHTDNVPISNNEFANNWELSFHRSFSVVQYFINKFKFSPKQLSCLGYGEYKPLVPNNTVENRSKNRRIEINIIRVKKSENAPADAPAGEAGATTPAATP